jgi:hypothetical protein
MTVLYEMRQLRPDLLYKHQVFIDGGVTRGTDVLKALCLGARAVGLGRAFLYANGVWGEEGCMRVISSKCRLFLKRMTFEFSFGAFSLERRDCVGDATARRDRFGSVDSSEGSVRTRFATVIGYQNNRISELVWNTVGPVRRPPDYIIILTPYTVPLPYPTFLITFLSSLSCPNWPVVPLP